jgi:hypothetical protein
MTTISIRNNFPDIARRLNGLQDAIANKATARALNKTIDQGKNEMARKIAAEYRITAGNVKKRLSVRRASTRRGLEISATLAASTAGKGRSMNLIGFVTRGKVSKAAAKRLGNASLAGQLQFQIKRGGGKKIKPGAFIGNQGRTVFKRTGDSRLPIEPVHTIGVPQMFNARRINDVVRQVMLTRFRANFERELRSVLQGYAR